MGIESGRGCSIPRASPQERCKHEEKAEGPAMAKRFLDLAGTGLAATAVTATPSSLTER